MRKLRSAVLGVLCFPLAATAANTFLVRPSGDSSTLKIEAFGIQFPVRTVDVQPSPKLTVFVYLDGMSPTAWDRTKTALGSLRNATKNGGFRFLVVSGGEVRAITWKTADQFASEIRKLAPTTFTDEKPDWFADSSIVELLPEATEDWESLVIVSEPRLINNPIIRDYLQTLAVHQLVTNKLRLSFWAVAAASPDDAAATWNRVTQASCGELLPPDEPPTAWVERVKSSQCQAVSFDPPQILAGFVPYNAKLLNPQQPAMELPALLLGPTSQPLTVSKYAELLRTFENARTAANSNLEDVVREALQQVLQGNPMHIETRRFAADLYKRQNDWATALQLMEPIALLSPLDADLFRELGDLQFELKNWSESENQFKRSQQLKPLQPATLERMSVIREQLGDLAGAADYIGQVIPTNTNRLDLYLRHARLLDRLQRLADASKSFEKALELDASLDDVRIRLAEIYKSIGNDVRPAELLNARANIPGDVSSRMQYAQLAEKLGLPSQALTFYASAIEADARHEPAYFGRAKLLVAADRTEDAYATVIAGLKANEKSLRLHLIKIDLLEKGDRLFQARDAIRQASELLPDEEPILRHLANVNDVFGNHGGETYERWAAAMERTGKASSEIQQALERGLTVALRDGEQQAADRIREKLARFSSTVLRPGARPLTGSAIVVPGGIPGLSQAVGIDPTVSPARFVAEYGRAILRTAAGPSTQRDKYKERIRLYLKTVQALKAFGRESGDSTEISIDVQTNQGVDRAEKILDLLGWRIRRSRNAFLLEVGTDEEAAVRQTFGAPLGVDEFSMKSRLEQRQPFTFRIVDQRAALIFDESYWFGTILKEPKPKRGFLEEMLENPSVTRLYIGLSSMNAETQRAIVQAVQPDQLLKRAVRLSFYASSIAIENGRVVVPGGEQASVPWSKLVEATPDRTGQFIGNLIRKDDGKLLSYYHSLAVLPQDHQRFFTRTPQRLAAFYKEFPFEDENNLENNFFYRRDDVFARMARELPLDQDGTILFPGSARVWSVAKGNSDNITDVQKMVKRVRRVNSPDAEDEILLNMLNRKYEVANRKVNQIENFLAVTKVDAHRTDPMDESMALTLSQVYGKYVAIFPYFVACPSLTGDQLTAFVKAAERIEKFDQSELNTVQGEFHSLIKLIVLLKETGKVSQSKCGEIFSSVSGKFAGAKSYQDIPAATFDSTEMILTSAGREHAQDADAFLLRAFSGESSSKELFLNGTMRSVDLSVQTAERIRDVLRLQSIAPLDTMLRTYRAAQSMARTPQASALTEIETNAPKLQEISEATGDKLTSKLREDLIVGRPAEVMRTVTKMKTELAKKNPSKEFPKLAAELIEELNPFLKTTLVGWIYAFYFSPKDLAVANDRYLVRHHVFYESVGKNFWPETRLSMDSTGGYLSGGFAQMASGAAALAKTKVEAAESLSTNPTQEAVTLAELSAVRSVTWHQISERSMHLVALKLRLARELVVRATFDVELRKEIAQATFGLLGVRRRFDLLQALTDSDVAGALGQLSSSDLLSLIDDLSKSPSSQRVSSVVATALTRETAVVQAEQMNYFGGLHPTTDGCSEPHLTKLAPYEEYENLLLPQPLAERLSDILLYLAEAADRLGLPLQGLAVLAEPAVQQFSTRVKMSHPNDWQSAIDAMRAIDLTALIPVLEKN